MKTITKQLIFAVFLMLSLVFVASAQAKKPAKTKAVKTIVKANTSKCPGSNGLTDGEISAIVEAHNKARADVGLPNLTWNCSLANTAQEWATRGIFEHRPGPMYGENLFVDGAASVSPVTGVENWLAEKSAWNNSAGNCQAGKVCSHYTQMVWKNTNAIGCGINRNAPGKWKVLFVCNYSPMGNYSGKAY